MTRAASEPMTGKGREEAGFPTWVWVVGAACTPGTAAYMVRTVWEETALTAEQGPQAVGFALWHGALGWITVPMLLSTLVLHLWGLVVVPLALFQSLWRRRALPRMLVAILIIATITVVPLFVPYGWWRYAILKTVGPGSHAGDYLTYAAAFGEIYNVRELLRNGVSIETTSFSGGTALRAASTAGQLQMVRYLAEQGADVNRREGVLGRTALIAAADMGHPEIIGYLLGVGADPSVRDDKGRSALDCARGKGNEASIALLERATAK